VAERAWNAAPMLEGDNIEGMEPPERAKVKESWWEIEVRERETTLAQRVLASVALESWTRMETMDCDCERKGEWQARKRMQKVNEGARKERRVVSD